MANVRRCAAPLPLATPTKERPEMDLIATLTQQLGVSPEKAQGLAGGVLTIIRQQLAERLGPEQAAQLQARVPEMSSWAEKATTVNEPSASSGLLGALGSVAGGGATASLTQLVGLAGLGPASLQTVIPAVLEFLKARLEPEQLQKVLSAVPALQGVMGSETGGLMGALGGLLGKR